MAEKVENLIEKNIAALGENATNEEKMVALFRSVLDTTCKESLKNKIMTAEEVEELRKEGEEHIAAYMREKGIK